MNTENQQQNKPSHKYIFKNKEEDFQIEEIHHGDLEAIVEFQKHLAIDSEDINLNLEIVRSATSFILNNEEYGIHFIIRTLPPQVENVSFALMCAEYDLYSNNPIWWYNSVFTEKKYRRRGLFAEMHQFILKWAGKSKIKLYADDNNEGALKCYDKLGLKDTNEIFMECDLFFRKDEIHFQRNKDLFQLSIGQIKDLDLIYSNFNQLISTNGNPNLQNNEGLSTILKSIKNGGVILVREQATQIQQNNSNSVNNDNIVCMVVFGYEYSEWKNGFNLIITDLRFNSNILLNQKEKAQLIIENIAHYLKEGENELEGSVKSIRFIVNKNSKEAIELLTNSKFEQSHYVILSN